MDPRIREIEQEYMRDDLPAFDPGDTVRVRVRVREGDKERIQAFEGVCIARRGSGSNASFTVRKVSGGVGVERVFPLHTPSIAGIEVVRRGHVRRAKLYYLRARRGKKARVRERSWWLDQAREMGLEAEAGDVEVTGEVGDETAEAPEAEAEAVDAPEGEVESGPEAEAREADEAAEEV